MNTSAPVQVTRRPEKFVSDDRRVITRFFAAGGEERRRGLIDRVMGLSEEEVQRLLEQVLENFSGRHRNLEAVLHRHFNEARPYVPHPEQISRLRRLLIGAYFTMEYSVESAALFNPSIVRHPDQSGLEEGQARFIMSLRATGEGHLSSIVFRTGVIDAEGKLTFAPPSQFVARLRLRQDRLYEKKLFRLKLEEMSACTDAAREILGGLGPWFTMDQLEHIIYEVSQRAEEAPGLPEAADTMLWLAQSNYHLELPPNTDPNQVVIFPSSESESRGIEDLRLTRFVGEDGEVTYYGTYTAYNGYRILPQLLETKDFSHIAVHTLNGRHAQNKGLALFPRKIDGRYHMISRLDGENMYLMRSNNVHFWNEAEMLQGPRYPWEFIQVGNCGPPIETEAGWLLLTHGVGPMRQYCIGVSLLDLHDPTKIIGHLPEPLLVPDENERDGYVPNVVYSCGAMVHAGKLVIPYAMSDRATGFATVEMEQLLTALRHNGGVTPLGRELAGRGQGSGTRDPQTRQVAALHE